jgi:hypothetical protein
MLSHLKLYLKTHHDGIIIPSSSWRTAARPRTRRSDNR